MPTSRISPSRAGLVAFALIFVFTPSPANAQSDDLNIYGYFQAQYSHNYGEFGPEEIGTRTFRLPQLNVLAAKNIGADFNAFVNVELLNGFNTGADFGAARIGEAWAQYEQGKSLKVKGGLLIPEFNNLNEIKNRTPLLPYTSRPLVYEQSFRSTVAIGSYVPQRAYLQAHGSLPAGDIRVDYAAYVGNSSSQYLASGNSQTLSGTDTTYTKLFGGRVGVQYRSLKAGVSGTIDEANLRRFSYLGTTVPAGLGDVDRYRIGGDLSFDFGDFFVESEIISVRHSLTDKQETQWDALRQQPGLQDLLGENVDQLFYYGMLGYNITSKIDVNVMYNGLETNRASAIFRIYSVGVSYRPVFPVRLKAEYRYNETASGSLSQNGFNFAASVTF